MNSKSWAPGHATLFFAVPESHDNYAQMGSIGGGINIEAGVTTKIGKSDKTKIAWNGNFIEGNVTRTVIQLFQDLTHNKIQVSVEHTSSLKIGYGLSTSGAGAIGTALSLNQLYHSNIENIELFEIAHKAEVMNHTGLGSVVGQITNGIELRLTQGGPKICRTLSFKSNSKLIVALLGPLSTKDVLTSAKQMELVTKSGIQSINSIKNKENLTLDDMIYTGKTFMQKCGLLTARVSKLIKNLEILGENKVTMAMIGESLVIYPRNIDAVLKFLKDQNIEYIITRVSETLPHCIE